MAWTACRGTSRRVGGLPWVLAQPADESARAPAMVGRVLHRCSVPSTATLERRKRIIRVRSWRSCLGPTRLAAANALFCIAFAVTARFLGLVPGPSSGVLSLTPLLMSLAVAVLLGNLLEGRFLELFGSRRHLDARGRALQALFHTFCVGLIPFGVFVPILYLGYALLTGDNYISSEGVMCLFVLTPPLWQMARALIGRWGSGRLAQHGPFEFIPSWAQCQSVSPSVGKPRASSFAVSCLGAACVAVFLAPYGIALVWGPANSSRFRAEPSSAEILTVVTIGVETLAAAFAAASVVFARSRSTRRRSTPEGKGPPDARPPFHGRDHVRILIPWMSLWGLLLLAGIVAFEGIPTNPPGSWIEEVGCIAILFTCPVGLVQAVWLGTSYGFRRRTLPAAATQAFWFQAFWTGSLALGPSLATWVFMWFGPVWASRLGGGFQTILPGIVAVAVAASVVVARLAQALVATVYRRRALANAASPAPVDLHPWGGAVFRWGRLSRHGPIFRRTLGLPPYGGHRWFTFLRGGVLLWLATVAAVLLSAGIQGIDDSGSMPFWGGLALFFSPLLLTAHGGWAAVLGVMVARRARLSGEDQELHLSLLRSEQIIAGRLRAILVLTFLWTALVPLTTYWPFVFMDEFRSIVFYLSLAGVFLIVSSVATSAGDAAVGLWLGSRWRSGVGAGLVGFLWGLVMGGMTFVGGLFAAVLGAVLVDETMRLHSETAMGFFMCWGLALMAIPIVTRLTLGDWLGRRLAADFSGERPVP